ncbi:MAG: FimV/HubP family polar landmark protein [Thiotrichaceae bacterium]
MKNRTARQSAQKTALSLAISMVMAYPVASQALGLGELHSSSQLDQPLNAQIDLLSTNAKEARQLKVRLASAEVFSRVGIDRPAFLDSLKFTPDVQKGKPVIRVTSSVPISEPFLNFLLEVSWPQGQLLKEYTVLLDPPVLLNTGSASTENAVAVRAEPKPGVVSGAVNRGQEAERQRQLALQQQQRQRQLEVQRQQQAQQSQANRQQQEFEAQAQTVLNETSDTSARTTATRSTKYRVKRGDTMSRIASRLRYRGVSNNQMMVALFRANPKAFSNSNINDLRSGVLLEKPSKSDVVGRSSSESQQIVKQHYSQWKKYRSGLASKTVAQSAVTSGGTSSTSTTQVGSNDQANLSVVGSSDKSVSANQASAVGNAELEKQLILAQEALASSKSESAELHARVSKLEAIIRKKERLITLKNDKLARLETQLGGTVANTTTTDEVVQETPVNESEDLVQQVANQTEQNNNRIIRGDEEGTVNQPETALDKGVSQTAVNAVLESPADEAIAENEITEANPFKTNNDTDSKGGILDLLSSPLVAAIGGGGLLALLFGWLLMRRSSTAVDDHMAEEVKDEKGDDDFFDDESESFVSPIENDMEDVADSKDTSTDDFFADNTSDTSTNDVDTFDSILSGDDTFEEDEILQEADVYIVYGLHEQAEDELKKAIANNPSKLEYRYKLLENYKAASDPESFVSTAKDFLKAEGDNKQQLWDKIVDWGKEVSPENELFSELSAQTAAGMVAGVASVSTAANIAKEAFSDNGPGSFTDNDFADALPPELDSTEDLNISGLDDGDFNLDLGDELGADLDLGDDFGLDELAGEFDAKDNILDFGGVSTSDDLTSIDLEIDQDNGLDKILPTGNGYTSTTTNESNDDTLDDALSFLDLSDDDEEVQQAHIGTKLDLARAYLDMGDVEGARHTLEEVVIEGNDDQKREAEELLQQTG